MQRQIKQLEFDIKRAQEYGESYYDEIAWLQGELADRQTKLEFSLGLLDPLTNPDSLPHTHLDEVLAAVAAYDPDPTGGSAAIQAARARHNALMEQIVSLRLLIENNREYDSDDIVALEELLAALEDELKRYPAPDEPDPGQFVFDGRVITFDTLRTLLEMDPATTVAELEDFDRGLAPPEKRVGELLKFFSEVRHD